MNFIKMFNMIDKDNSGDITKSDLVDFMHANNFTEKFVETWLALFDFNKKGRITIDDYCERLGLVIDENMHAYLRVHRPSFINLDDMDEFVDVDETLEQHIIHVSTIKPISTPTRRGSNYSASGESNGKPNSLSDVPSKETLIAEEPIVKKVTFPNFGPLTNSENETAKTPATQSRSRNETSDSVFLENDTKVGSVNQTDLKHSNNKSNLTSSLTKSNTTKPISKSSGITNEKNEENSNSEKSPPIITKTKIKEPRSGGIWSFFNRKSHDSEKGARSSKTVDERDMKTEKSETFTIDSDNNKSNIYQSKTRSNKDRSSKVDKSVTDSHASPINKEIREKHSKFSFFSKYGKNSEKLVTAEEPKDMKIKGIDNNTHLDKTKSKMVEKTDLHKHTEGTVEFLKDKPKKSIFSKWKRSKSKSTSNDNYERKKDFSTSHENAKSPMSKYPEGDNDLSIEQSLSLANRVTPKQVKHQDKLENESKNQFFIKSKSLDNKNWKRDKSKRKFEEEEEEDTASDIDINKEENEMQIGEKRIVQLKNNYDSGKSFKDLKKNRLSGNFDRSEDKDKYISKEKSKFLDELISQMDKLVVKSQSVVNVADETSISPEAKLKFRSDNAIITDRAGFQNTDQKEHGIKNQIRFLQIQPNVQTSNEDVETNNVLTNTPEMESLENRKNKLTNAGLRNQSNSLSFKEGNKMNYENIRSKNTDDTLDTTDSNRQSLVDGNIERNKIQESNSKDFYISNNSKHKDDQDYKQIDTGLRDSMLTNPNQTTVGQHSRILPILSENKSKGKINDIRGEIDEYQSKNVNIPVDVTSIKGHATNTINKLQDHSIVDRGIGDTYPTSDDNNLEKLKAYYKNDIPIEYIDAQIESNEHSHTKMEDKNKPLLVMKENNDSKTPETSMVLEGILRNINLKDTNEKNKQGSNKNEIKKNKDMNIETKVVGVTGHIPVDKEYHKTTEIGNEPVSYNTGGLRPILQNIYESNSPNRNNPIDNKLGQKGVFKENPMNTLINDEITEKEMEWKIVPLSNSAPGNTNVCLLSSADEYGKEAGNTLETKFVNLGTDKENLVSKYKQIQIVHKHINDEILPGVLDGIVNIYENIISKDDCNLAEAIKKHLDKSYERAWHVVITDDSYQLFFSFENLVIFHYDSLTFIIWKVPESIY